MKATCRSQGTRHVLLAAAVVLNTATFALAQNPALPDFSLESLSLCNLESTNEFAVTYEEAYLPAFGNIPAVQDVIVEINIAGPVNPAPPDRQLEFWFRPFPDTSPCLQQTPPNCNGICLSWIFLRIKEQISFQIVPANCVVTNQQPQTCDCEPDKTKVRKQFEKHDGPLQVVGDYTVTVTIDPDNLVAELDETNNTLTSVLTAASPSCRLGTQYCQNKPNSTGFPGSLAAMGDTSAAQQDVLLIANRLPPNQFGYFIASRTQGFVPNPGGSLGHLCVVGNQGRYDGQVLTWEENGETMLQVGDINVPTNPAPGETIVAGDTWNWQLWYRDVGDTSNFTNGLSVTFD